jgi:hypothetical protein
MKIFCAFTAGTDSQALSRHAYPTCAWEYNKPNQILEGTALKKIPIWQTAGFIFTGILGTFLHFLFDLTGGSLTAALVSAVNESIWEHMKLLFYPMVLFAAIAYFYWGKNVDSFWCVKLLGILYGLVLIPVLYYSYTGIFGVSADWFNITIFFLAAGAVYWLETKLFQRGFSCALPKGAAVLLILLIGVAFTALTFLPPEIPLFRDPLTGTYGYQ